ncbi:GNAT family N-acetyltransferase [bacterium]|nr:GNAT family N-acetyltransferase [bacterium]
MQVKPLTDTDQAWVQERTELLFSGTFLVSRETVHDPTKLPGFIADQDGERIGLVTYHIDGDACEVVSIDALCQYIGVGTSLLEAVEAAAREAGCARLWVILTNDNLDALRFFQRRGFTISAFRIDSLDSIRQLKPGIPQVGSYGIPVRDEIELIKPVDTARGWRVV